MCTGPSSSSSLPGSTSARSQPTTAKDSTGHALSIQRQATTGYNGPIVTVIDPPRLPTLSHAVKLLVSSSGPIGPTKHIHILFPFIWRPLPFLQSRPIHIITSGVSIIQPVQTHTPRLARLPHLPDRQPTRSGPTCDRVWPWAFYRSSSRSRVPSS